MPLVIHQPLIDEMSAGELVKLCPFRAISYENGELFISAACKMCMLCVHKGPKGAVEFVEEQTSRVDKNAWRGIAVFSECHEGSVHPVAPELLGKALELARATGHPVYALLIGTGLSQAAKQLLRYGAQRVFVYDDPALRRFVIDAYANAFADFIEKVRPSSVLVGATGLGRALAPRVAARFRTGLTADCTMLEMKENTDLVQIRPAFGGNIGYRIIIDTM
jgi:electron transfer flavoprotein alpha subunit